MTILPTKLFYQGNSVGDLGISPTKGHVKYLFVGKFGESPTIVIRVDGGGTFEQVLTHQSSIDLLFVYWESYIHNVVSLPILSFAPIEVLMGYGCYTYCRQAKPRQNNLLHSSESDLRHNLGRLNNGLPESC